MPIVAPIIIMINTKNHILILPLFYISTGLTWHVRVSALKFNYFVLDFSSIKESCLFTDLFNEHRA
jgi:hypothetical protein